MSLSRRLFVLILLFLSMLSPVLIVKAQAACSSTCNLEVDTNVPASSGTLWVRADSGTPYPLNHTYSFPFNTTHTLQIMNTTIYAASGARYVFKQWLLNGAQWGTLPTITTPETVVDYTSTSGNGAFEAQFEKQYQLSLAFVDPSNQPIKPASSVTLSGPYSITLTYTNQSVNQYSSQWLSATVWTVQDASWEGEPGMVLSPNSGPFIIDLTKGSITAPVNLKAYPATIRITDSSNNPLPGATATITMVNGTTATFTSDTQGVILLGRIPLGTYSTHITYQGQDMGTFTVDASLYPTDTIKLSTGAGATTPIISVVVLVTIFGLALFLIILAMKLRKAPPPPKIA